ncbi:MAG: hypothetical protein ACKVWV_07615 [Planctomycetota bacterium]
MATWLQRSKALREILVMAEAHPAIWLMCGIVLVVLSDGSAAISYGDSRFSIGGVSSLDTQFALLTIGLTLTGFGMFAMLRRAGLGNARVATLLCLVFALPPLCIRVLSRARMLQNSDGNRTLEHWEWNVNVRKESEFTCRVRSDVARQRLLPDERLMFIVYVFEPNVEKVRRERFMVHGPRSVSSSSDNEEIAFAAEGPLRNLRWGTPLVVEVNAVPANFDASSARCLGDLYDAGARPLDWERCSIRSDTLDSESLLYWYRCLDEGERSKVEAHILDRTTAPETRPRRAPNDFVERSNAQFAPDVRKPDSSASSGALDRPPVTEATR